MLVVGSLEQFRGAFAADDSSGSQHFWRLSGLGQAIGHLGLDGVHKHASADGGAGSDRCVHPVDRRHRIAHRRAGVENQIGEVL